MARFFCFSLVSIFSRDCRYSMEEEENGPSDEPESKFLASFIRYKPSSSEKLEQKRANLKVKNFPKFLRFLGIEELFLPGF